MAEDESAESVFHDAAFYGRLDILEELWFRRKVSDVNYHRPSGSTPLLAAVGSQHVDVVRFLLAIGASTEIRTLESCTSLHIAAARGNVAITKLLCESKADVNAHGPDGRTALHIAQRKGFLQLASCLLEHGASAAEVDDNGSTVLMQACVLEDFEFASCCLDKLETPRKPALLNIQRVEDKMTALNLAAERGHLGLVDLLVRHGADTEVKNANGDSPLNTATKTGHEGVVEFLLANGAYIETTDVAGFTPLMAATCEGFASIAERLLAHNANVNHKNIHNASALHHGAELGHAGIVKSLLERGADPEARHESGSTPLMAAVREGNLEMVQLLADYGADLDCQLNTTDVMSALQSGPAAAYKKLHAWPQSHSTQWPTLLHFAAVRGDVGMVDLLCRLGAKVNTHSLHGGTALHAAFQGKSKDAVMCLLDHGASASAVDDDGLSVLLYACLIGDTAVTYQILRRLDDAGETEAKRALVNKPRTVDKWTPLHAAADLGRLALVKMLVRHGAEVDAKNLNGWSALNLATSKGDQAVVEFLLGSGADIETTNSNESTPLVIASKGGFIPIVEKLLESNANVNHTDIVGSTALFYAAMHGHAKIVKVLLERTDDPDSRNNVGWSPLLTAAQLGHVEVAKILIDHGADVNFQGYNHWTPLSFVAENGHVAFCKLLLEKGASLTLQTTDGQTALHLAASRNRQELIRELLAKGADPRAQDFHGRTPGFVALENGHVATAAQLDQLAGAGESEPHDKVWTQHSLRELYGLPNVSSRQRRAPQQNPPWYIDRASIEAHEECEHLSSLGVSVFFGTWLGAKVAVVAPTIIHFFETVDTSMDMGLKRQFREDVSKLYPLRHPHVARLYGASHRDQNIFLVMENPQNGTLRSFVEENDGSVWKRLYEAALGIQYLHERGIVHGHLMGDHILLGDDGLVKLSGIGTFATSLNGHLNSVWNAPQTTDPRNPLFDNQLHAQGKRLLQEIAGKIPHARPPTSGFTEVWTAPEVVLGQDATVESDIYSLGMCVIEAVSAESPYAFEVAQEEDLKKLVIDGVPPRRPAAFTDRGWELVLKMVCFEPQKRLKISEVVRELAALANEEEVGRIKVVSKNTTALKIGDDEGSSDKSLCALSEDAIGLDKHGDETSEWHVLHRLHDLRQAVTELEPEGRELVGPLLQDIWKRVQSDLKVNAVVHERGAFVTQRMRADRVFAFHNEIDHVLDQFVSVLPAEATRPALHAWRDQWYTDRRKQLQALGASLDRVNELDVETATCLLFELTRRRDAYTSIPSAKIHTACSEMRSLPGVRVPDWFIPHYEVQFKLNNFNEGAFGSVHYGEWMGSRVVVKKLKKEFATDGVAFEKEVEIWSQLYHPHVLQLFGACHVGQKILVSEFAAGSRMDFYLHKLEAQPAIWKREVWRTLYEAALGLQYLHTRGIVHCDLKCNNILIGRDRKAKVSDYGLSRTKQQPQQTTNESDTTSVFETPAKPTGVGAPRWKAPEVLKGAEPTVESDIYSFGMCVVEAVTGEYPWGMEEIDKDVSDHVRRGGALFEKPRRFSDAQWALVVGACRFHPSERLQLSEIISQLQAFAHEASKSQDDDEIEHDLDDQVELGHEVENSRSLTSAFSDEAATNATDSEHVGVRVPTKSYSDSW